ncbi:MAG: lipopolysaccharide biosynthesis protein [Pseudomonadota bacterium]|nr:lipopolysaccharide biosynthesis protein [Pseudomonadota bacterium]
MIGRRLFASAAYQLFGWGVGIGVTLVLTPTIISNLGVEAYGLWLLAASIFGFYGVLDLGLSVAAQRAINQSLARNELVEANRAVITSAYVFSIIGLVAALLTVGIAAAAGKIVKSDALVEDFRLVVLLLGFSLALMFPTYAISGIFTANLRTDISSRIHLCKMLVRSSVIYVLVKGGYGVVAMALVTALTDVCASFVMLVFARRLAPWCRWDSTAFDVARLWQMARVGASFLVITITGKAKGPVPAFAMNASLGLSGVSLFGVAQQLFDYYSRFMFSVVEVFQPLFIRQESQGLHDRNRGDFHFAMEISMLVALVLGAGVLGSVDVFITTWLGTEFRVSVPAAIVLICTGGLSLAFQPVLQIAVAYGRQAQLAAFSIIELGVVLVAAVPASTRFGLVGLALAISLPGVLLRMFVLPVLIWRCIHFSVTRLLGVLAGTGASLALAYLASGWLAERIDAQGYVAVVILGTAAAATATVAGSVLCLSSATRRRIWEFAQGFVARKTSATPES